METSARGNVPVDLEGRTESHRAPAPRLPQRLLGITLAGLGAIGLVEGDFALVWQRIPIADLPARQVFAYGTAAVELAAGLGLLWSSTARIAARLAVVLALLWVVLLKLPAVVAVPSMPAVWLGFGEIAVLLAGTWIAFADNSGAWEDRHLARLTGVAGRVAARFLFGAALPMIGLSHFVYSAQTAGFVPAWLPFRLGWAYLTGAGFIAAGLAVLFGVWPRLAATLEAAMLSIITALVWGPGLFRLPADRTQWTGFFISAAITAGSWVVADSYRAVGFLASGRVGYRALSGAQESQAIADYE